MGPPSQTQIQGSMTWTDAIINALFDVYEEKYIHIQRGNLGKRHWNEIVLEFNKKCDLALTKEQCRSKLDNLKKRYKKERENFVTTSGGIPSTWDLYDRCDILWGCTPKGAGIPGGMDSGVPIPLGRTVNLDDYFDLNEDCVPSNPSTPNLNGYEASPDSAFVEGVGSREEEGEKVIDGTQIEQTSTTRMESPREKVCDIPSVEGKASSKRKRKAKQSPTKSLTISLDRFVDVLKHDSEMKIQLARDQLAMAQHMHSQQAQLEAQRMELEKMKLEMKERAALRAEDLKLKCARMKLDFSDFRGGSSS